MELTNDFRVGVPVGKAWDVLTDVELIAPCLPGAQLQEIEGDEYRGIVKVKVGPITAQYKGAAHFIEKDTTNHKAVLKAEGRDTRGQGNASATITATLTPDGDGTAVSVVTDLAVTGKVAQFGRGVLADVSAKLLDQFVAALEEKVLSQPAADPAPAEPAPTGAAGDEAKAKPEAAPEAAPETGAKAADAPPAAPSATNGVRTIDSAPAQPVDLLDAAGGSVVKRVGPAVSALVVIGWMLVRWRRKRKK